VAGSPNPPLLFQYVNNNFRMRMQLLENNNRITTLATPLLLTANNEVSRLFVGQDVPLNLGFTGPTPIVNAAGTSTAFTAGSTSIQFRPVGTDLLITPNINADRTVTLRIIQEVSNVIKGGADVYLPTSNGFTQSPIDIVNAQSVSGTVVGMDGLTVAIGGLIQENLTDSRAEVPILGKLPIVGFFFRQQSTARTRTELIILIRPYVFSTPCEATCTSAKVVQELSIHPKAIDPNGTLNSFLPHEVLRANPPVTECQKIFRFHSLEPKTY
jgi:general secretion pathway protein D